MKKLKESYSIQAVENALNVLEQFKGEKAELGITELSQTLGLHKNNVFRLLATLESRGYIEQNMKNENYRLGIKALELGSAFLSNTGLIKVAVEKLEEVSSEVNETVYLGILKENQVFYIEDWEAKQALRVTSRLGTQMSPLCTATGKIILAHLGEDEQGKIIKANKFIKHTPHTIPDEKGFMAELAAIKKVGYAVDWEEKDKGITCVAGPILNYNSHVVAAISISGPTTRLSRERIENFYSKKVLEVCGKISTAIGYMGSPKSSI